MKPLIKRRLDDALNENIQQADKLYFNSGKLPPEAKEVILSITHGDNYTKLVADLLFHMSQFNHDLVRDRRMYERFYEELKRYDKNIFPVVGNLTDYGITNSNDFHILSLAEMLPKREFAVKALKKLPSVAIRNLKTLTQTPQKDGYFFDDIAKKLNRLADILQKIPDNERTAPLKNKIFTSKNGLQGMLDTAEQFQYAFSGSNEETSREEILDNIQYTDSDLIQDSNGVIVIRVNSQEAMATLSCTSHWCFSRPGAMQYWYDYAPKGFLYLIFNLKESYTEATFLLVYLPDVGTVYVSTNVTLPDVDIDEPDIVYLTSIGVDMKKIDADSEDESRGEREDPDHEEDNQSNYQREGKKSVKILVRETLEQLLQTENIECVSLEALDKLRVQSKSTPNFDLEKSMETNGINKPIIIVYHVHDNKAAISDGHNRLDIAKNLGMDCIPAKVIVSGADAPQNAQLVKEPKWKGKDELKPSEIGLQ